MDITFRLSWISVVAILMGCGTPEQPLPENRPTAETAQAKAPDRDHGGLTASPSSPGPKEGTGDGSSPNTEASGTSKPDTVEPTAASGAAKTSGPTLEQWQAWAEALAGNDDRARQDAVEELDKLAAAGAVSFVDLLRHASPEVRRCAAFCLIGRFDPSDAAMVQAFTGALADEDELVRHMALSVAARFPREAQVAATGQLAAALERENETPANRAAIARLIGTLESDARPALPALLKSLRNDPDKSVRSASLMAVSRVAERPEAMAAFRRALTDDQEPAVRGLAAVRLGRFGAAAVDAAPDLANALEDRDEKVARKAADALVAIGAGAVPAAAGKLTSTKPSVRRLAVFVLGTLGPPAAPALEALRKRLQDEDDEVRKLAELAIRRIQGSEP